MKQANTTLYWFPLCGILNRHQPMFHRKQCWQHIRGWLKALIVNIAMCVYVTLNYVPRVSFSDSDTELN